MAQRRSTDKPRTLLFTCEKLVRRARYAREKQPSKENPCRFSAKLGMTNLLMRELRFVTRVSVRREAVAS